MDLWKLDQLLEEGRKIFVKYEYPSKVRNSHSGSIYRIRTDRLLDVAPDRDRLFVEFDGTTPIWIEKYEAIDAWVEKQETAEVAA